MESGGAHESPQYGWDRDRRQYNWKANGNVFPVGLEAHKAPAPKTTKPVRRNAFAFFALEKCVLLAEGMWLVHVWPGERALWEEEERHPADGQKGGWFSWEGEACLFLKTSMFFVIAKVSGSGG